MSPPPHTKICMGSPLDFSLFFEPFLGGWLPSLDHAKLLLAPHVPSQHGSGKKLPYFTVGFAYEF